MSKSEWEDYLKRYVEWVHENKQYIYAAVELDVGFLVGMPIIHSWREKYFAQLEYAGIQVIYVWHIEDGEDEWESMCRKYRYAGLPHSTFQQGITPRLMLTARRYRAKVHGFAITSSKAIRDFTMATADSTSWKSGERYGQWVMWDGKVLRSVDKHNRHKWKTTIERRGYDWGKLMQDDALEVSTMLLKEFRTMEEHYANTNRVDNYWEVRTPYPEVVDKLNSDNMSDWLSRLDLVEEVYEQYSDKEILRAVSLLQNCRIEDFLKEGDKNNDIISKAAEFLSDVHDEISHGRVLDEFNGRFKSLGAVRPRNSAVLLGTETGPRDREYTVAEEFQQLQGSEEDHEIDQILQGDDDEGSSNEEEKERSRR